MPSNLSNGSWGPSNLEELIIWEIMGLQDAIKNISYRLRYLIITSEHAWQNLRQSLAHLQTPKHGQQQNKAVLLEKELREKELNKNTDAIDSLTLLREEYRMRLQELYTLILTPSRHSTPRISEVTASSSARPNMPSTNAQKALRAIGTELKSFQISGLKPMPKIQNRFKM